jgi:hypothetical protein
MNNPFQLVQFDRSKPFYPLVLNYFIQLIGFKELVIRGVLGGSDLKQAVSKITGLADEKSEDAAKLAIELQQLLGPLQLASSVSGTYLLLPADDIAKEFASNVLFVSNHLMLSAGSVLILSHELCKDKPAHDQGPLWEFLRHCRNAAGHGGKFSFQNREPRRPAKWRALEIVAGLHGTPLFKGTDGVGFLCPADPILLLLDIEQGYPALI